MDISIRENLKKFRREKGNTQEELADHLGISMQAVSKWERGEGYPDITLIPAIALYYNVTSDQLLGMDEKAVEAKIEEYRARSMKISRESEANWDSTEHQIKQIALWREAQKEFPNNHRVLFHLLSHLVWPVHNSGKYFDEIVQIGERLLAESTDNETRFNTINFLCDAYAKQKDFETAKKYANMVPSYHGSREKLYLRCLSGDERVEYGQKLMQDFIDTICHLPYDMMRDSSSLHESIEMLESCHDLYHFIYSDGDFGDKELIMTIICTNLANWYAIIHNDDKVLFYISELAEHYAGAVQVRVQGEFKYTSRMVKRLTAPKMERPKGLLRGHISKAVNQIEESKLFDSVRNDESYLSAINRMKSLIQELDDENVS